ncbi:unnamed protein product [Adineta ricciae]|uniref:Uncharacterized protein n=1 Tax=Adineta ricciae TaxID=249248 RepID=A0A816C3U3_ADIRI|nr:unnamed protein product [Adineta ricciae]CAF1618995.1 unnamed protein product [Adineta ricciae]
MSSANSCTIDSVFYEENSSAQNLPILETVKLDLLIQSKTLGDNMKSLLTLMSANQVNQTEQKQVYENIKQDYEQLIRKLEQKKQTGNFNDVDLDGDLNTELELMKQLLREIASRITGNLFGKSNNNSPTDRRSVPIYEDSHSSQYDRSSLCNHDDLMEQYKKLLTAVNTENTDQNDRMKSMMDELETDLKKSQITSPRLCPPDLFPNQIVEDNKQKAYVYTSAGSDDEPSQSDNISPIPFTKSVESTSAELHYIPSSSVEQHQHKIQEEPSKPKISPRRATKKTASSTQEYHRLGDIRKPEPKDILSDVEQMRQSSLVLPNDATRNSYCSIKTRVQDCDSGIGTNTVTKLASDSKHTSPIDESQLHSLDEDQVSISSSLHSSGTDSGSLYRKHNKRFTNPTLRQRKQDHQSTDYSYLSEIDTYVTHPFDPLPQLPPHNKKLLRSNQVWKPQRTSSPQRARIGFVHRSASIGVGDIEKYKTKLHHPLNATQIHSEVKTQPTVHRSSLLINHTPEKSNLDPIDKFYFDSNKRVIYRYRTNEPRNSITVDQSAISQKKVYRCGKCGSVTPYHHRRHGTSVTRESATQADDLGYESGHKQRNQPYRYTQSISSSESDSDLSANYLQMIALNEAYERAEKVENCSQRLSRYITRQLRLALTLI